jgi:hypothetical protein
MPLSLHVWIRLIPTFPFNVRGENMNSIIGLAVVLFLVTACASSPKPEKMAEKQAISIEARDREGIPLMGISCNLSNDKGSWKTITPGHALVDQSLTNMSISCVSENMSGSLVVSPGMNALACQGGQVCGYPSVVSVTMRERNPIVSDGKLENQTLGGKSRVAKMKVTGFGAPPRDETMSPAQKRLLAMRASKLDAYRALTEQLHGVRISGTTTVGDIVVKQDSFRVYLDAYLHGAVVLNTMQQPDGAYETEMEISLGNDFYRQFTPGVGCGVLGGVGPGCQYFQDQRSFYISQ